MALMAKRKFKVSDGTLRALKQLARDGAEAPQAMPVVERCPGESRRRGGRQERAPSLMAVVERDEAGRTRMLLRCAACGFEVEIMTD